MNAAPSPAISASATPSRHMRGAYRIPGQAANGASWQFPDRSRLITFLVWGACVGLAFFCIYPLTNWLAGYRNHQHALFLARELNIPFVPEFIWVYLSMYALFLLPPFFLPPGSMPRLAKTLILATCIAGLSFLAFPARLGFPRILPDDSLHRPVFEALFAIDLPYNLVPSLHVVYSSAIVLAITARAGRTARILLFCWLALIMTSTILVHQHHILDVSSGLALALLMHCHGRRRNA